MPERFGENCVLGSKRAQRFDTRHPAADSQLATAVPSPACHRCSGRFLTGHRLCDHIVERLRILHEKPEPRLW